MLGEALQGLADRGRVMAEVVDDRNAADDTADFLTALDTAELHQGLPDDGGRDAVEMSRGDSHGGVADIELPRHRDLKLLPEDLEPTTPVLLPGMEDPVAGILREPDFHDRGMAVARDIDAVRIVRVHQHHALRRDDIQEPPEAELDLVEILEDVRMVELDVVHHHQFRQVVEELGALVEEGRVVLISLDHEVPRGRGISQAGPLSEIRGEAADQVRGLLPGVLQDPRRHGGRGGLSVGAGDDDVVAAAQEMGAEDFGERGVVELPVQHGLDLGIATRDGVADDDKSLLFRKILGAVSREDLDAALGKEVAHRREGLIIRPRDDPPLLLHSHGDSAHRGPADPEKMDAARGGFAHGDGGKRGG